MYGTTQEAAEQLAAKAPLGPQYIDGKNVIVDRYEVRAHSWHKDTQLPKTWGIWPVWAYADRPDLGAQFGGPFRRLDSVR